MTEIASPKDRAESVFQRTLNQALVERRAPYQNAYLEQHGWARLGSPGNQLKPRMVQEPLVKQLRPISTVDLMPAHQPYDLPSKPFSLQTCFSLTIQDLESVPACAHCSFRPSGGPIIKLKAGE